MTPQYGLILTLTVMAVSIMFSPWIIWHFQSENYNPIFPWIFAFFDIFVFVLYIILIRAFGCAPDSERNKENCQYFECDEVVYIESKHTYESPTIQSNAYTNPEIKYTFVPELSPVYESHKL